MNHGYISKATPEGQLKISALPSSSHFLLLPTLADCTPVACSAAIANYNWINENREESAPTGMLQPEPGILDNWLYKIASRQMVQPPAVAVKQAVYEKLGDFLRFITARIGKCGSALQRSMM